ncbi:MAG TPA: deaminase [Patescibacteria group bacterium]
MSMKQLIVAYVPVIHAGYLRFFEQFADVPIYLLAKEVTDQFRPLQKDIRALDPEHIKISLAALFPDRKIEVLGKQQLAELKSGADEAVEIVMPDEEVSRAIAQEHLVDKKVEFVSVFLRWDRAKSTVDQEIEAHEVISHDQFDQQMMERAQSLKNKSADWWRQVGAVVVQDGQVIGHTYNRHVPEEQQPYLDGDPRADFSRGDHIDVSTALHAEAGLIAEAAKSGTSLAGASLYVTTFPCPNCAKLIAYAGIKKVYFEEGYAMVDGQRILEDNGVEIVRVKSI